MTVLTTGSEAVASRKRPEWVREQGNIRVTFWWRDPAGTQQTSAVKRVWLYIWRNRPYIKMPPTIPQTHPGYRRLANGRASSAPSGAAATALSPQNTDDFAPDVFTVSSGSHGAARRLAQALLPQAISDPLNTQSWQAGEEHDVSALEMPDAQCSPAGIAPMRHTGSRSALTGQSKRQATVVALRIFTTGDDDPNARWRCCSTGQFWAESMPVWPALTALLLGRKLPPAVY